MKIYAFHLLNDFSGSPKVLRQSINAWVNAGHNVTLVTSKGGEGFLSDIQGVDYQCFWYKLAANRILRLLFLVFSQLFLIMNLFFRVKKEDVIYINTVFPFGAACLGYLKGCRVIYHLHETSIKPAVLKSFLFGWMKLVADEIICVSHFLAKQEAIKNKKAHILHNALENEFIFQALLYDKKVNPLKNVLMVCSLKDYKGVKEYVQLAKVLPEYQFSLVLNTNRDSINTYFKNVDLPANLILFSTQTDLHPHYAKADIVLNLSRPDQWVETFGLTVLEAMAYSLPVIVPPVGGVTELVEDGINGFQVDCRNIEALSEKLKIILEDETRYKSMCIAALQKAQHFTQDIFDSKSLCLLEGKSFDQRNQFSLQSASDQELMNFMLNL